MDAVAIQTSIEVSSDCTDRERAAADLADVLASARAPRRGLPTSASAWRLDMRVTSAPGGVRIATARIVDDQGRFVADRTITDRTNGACVALAHAVGAWASVVLDDALGSDAVEHTRVPEPAPPPAPAPAPEMAAPAPASDRDAVTPTESTPKTYEVGTMLILRNGVAANGGIFGASPFMTVAFSEIWVLRPSVLVGTSTSPLTLTPGGNVTYLGGRVDFCRRLPGNYIDRKGIEVDVCAGADGGRAASRINDVARASVGPSAVIRGELGANLGLETRMVAGANLLRAGLGDDAPFFVVAGEVGASVRFR
jgi:hypothetical protein